MQSRFFPSPPQVVNIFLFYYRKIVVWYSLYYYWLSKVFTLKIYFSLVSIPKLFVPMTISNTKFLVHDWNFVFRPKFLPYNQLISMFSMNTTFLAQIVDLIRVEITSLTSEGSRFILDEEYQYESNFEHNIIMRFFSNICSIYTGWFFNMYLFSIMT
jgi:hypothetical protein